MRIPKQALVAITGMLLCVISGMAVAQSLPSWDFAASGKALGWTANSDARGFRSGKDGITAGPCGHDPIVSIAGLRLNPTPWQILQMDITTDRDGIWQVFWAHDDSGPYQGFSQQKSADFAVRAGNGRTYAVLPGWPEGRPVTKLRIDPLSDCTFTIRSISVIQLGAKGRQASPSWDFSSGAAGWSALPGSSIVTDRAGGALRLRAGQPGEALMSPPVRVQADSNTWVTIEATSEADAQAHLRWLGTGTAGFHSRPVALKGDGARRVYNLDLSGEAAWSGDILLIGVEPPEGSAGEVRLHSVSVQQRRGGTAEVRVRYAGFQEPFVRTGSASHLLVKLSNEGGQPSGPVTLRLETGGGLKLAEGQNAKAQIAGLEAGRSAEQVWRVIPGETGRGNYSVAATPSGGAATRVSGELMWSPELPAEMRVKADYVPQPVPVSTGDIQVGCYYFPGWHTYTRWDVLENFPERRPLLGYYREGDPEVADWHIKWAVEHGISFFIYDWYWSAGGRSLEHALHDGYLKSRYRSMMKFCLLWANHNAEGSSSLADMEAVTRYWIDNYFKLPEYLKIDGKPVMVIFSTGRFREDMGVEGTRKALDRAREICREAGIPGIYFVACTWPGADNIRLLEKEGYDALSGYNYPSAGDKGRNVAPYADNVEGYREFWQAIDGASTVPYIPVTDPGWDSRPWHGPGARVRTGKTPALFSTMLQNARDFVNTPGRRLPGGKKMVFVEAWNEFGEGDFIEPHREFGFGHVDAIRTVFGRGEEPHFDIVPSDVGLGPYEIPKPQLSTVWEFDSPEHGCSPQQISDMKVVDGAIRARSTGKDPAIYLSGTRLDAQRYTCMEIRMSVTAGKGAQLFWSPGHGFTEAWSESFPVRPDGQYHIYRLDLSRKPRWAGEIRQFRLDPTDAGGAEIRLDYVRPLEKCP